MNNKKRNEKILKIACDFLEKINFEVEKAFVEDVEGEENQVLVGVTVTNPAGSVSYTHLRAHETPEHLVCRLLLEKKNTTHHIY